MIDFDLPESLATHRTRQHAAELAHSFWCGVAAAAGFFILGAALAGAALYVL